MYFGIGPCIPSFCDLSCSFLFLYNIFQECLYGTKVCLITIVCNLLFLVGTLCSILVILSYIYLFSVVPQYTYYKLYTIIMSYYNILSVSVSTHQLKTLHFVTGYNNIII